jgi:tyrosine-protein kinase Etk/Wzc
VTLLVVRHMQTAPGEITNVLRAFENAGVKVSGAILNAYDHRRSKYGSYGYKYGYYYGGYSYRYSKNSD